MKYAFRVLIAVLAVCIFAGCAILRKQKLFRSAHLEMERITTHTYLHRSFLNDNKWGKVTCNGIVYINGGEALVFDTPTDDTAAEELINWIERKKGAKITGVVVTHFHADCLGGLASFHAHGIPSYANELTRKLARKDTGSTANIPQHGFSGALMLSAGGASAICKYYGEGHTRDNIVCYLPQERVLFGGCLIKANGSGKGNLNDANTTAWSGTVTRVKQDYTQAKYVVPGHGSYGDTSLLSYTISLFEEK